MQTARSVLNELKWRRDRDFSKVVVEYLHRGAPGDTASVAGPDILELLPWMMVVRRPGSRGPQPGRAAIPYHRVRRILHDGRVVFDRHRTGEKVERAKGGGEGVRTTVIGSFPLCQDELGREAVVRSVREQLQAGVRLVSDGQTRSDMIGAFAGVLEGVEMRSDKLHVTGRLGLRDPGPFVEDFRTAVGAAGGRGEVKAVLTGPATLAFSCVLGRGTYSGYRDARLFADASSAILALAKELEGTGARSFQLDEPYFSVGVPLELARRAVESIATGLNGEVALHACGDIRGVFGRLLPFKGVRVLSHGFAGTPANLSVVSRKELEEAEKLLGFGCVDTASERVESVEEILALLRKGEALAGRENLIVHPDCGLRGLPLEVARSKLHNMCVAAARL